MFKVFDLFLMTPEAKTKYSRIEIKKKNFLLNKKNDHLIFTQILNVYLRV